MHRSFAWLWVALLAACGDSEDVSTAQTSTSSGGATGGAGAAAGSSNGAGAGGSSAGGNGAVAGSGGALAGSGGSSGGAAGSAGTQTGGGGSPQGGAAGGPQTKVCQAFQVTGQEIGIFPATDQTGVGTFDLARLGPSSVFVLGVSELTATESLGFGQATSFLAGTWPSSDVGPFTKLEGVPLYDVALAPTTTSEPVALMLTITGSGNFSMSSFDPVSLQQTPFGSFGLGADATFASFVVQRPGGFVGAASNSVPVGGMPYHSTFALLAKQDGQSAKSSSPLACARGERPLVSAFHRDGEIVVAVASESSACKGDAPNLRLLRIADDDDTLTPLMTKEFPAPGSDLYETVLAADAGGGSTWIVARQLGLDAEVQPPAQVLRLSPDGSEAAHFSLGDQMLITRLMAVSSLSGNLLVALPDASIEGQGTVVVRLYDASGAIAGETSVGTPLAAGGIFPFIDRVRLLPLDGSSFVVAYQARGEPGTPSTVRVAKISCFGPD